MKQYINGKYVEMTELDILQVNEQYEQSQREYWLSVDYGEAINSEIRKKYTESQEFAILRQKDEKAEEYAKYFEYCENCKIYVKEQKRKYGGEID